ncbi:iron chaperone [Embleya sp. NPDC008237]|uniref:iron chaperone n=1 Tax=Embleya sp. NPDC008237 TaxID=3363978 RepID=UPI0036E3947F
MSSTKKSAARTTATEKSFEGFSAEERAAMKDHAQELKASARAGSKAAKAAEAEAAVVAKIAEMRDSDRVMAERLHAIVKENAPDLAPKLWYGMPAYARDGKVVCFFQSAEKFNARYATLGFSDQATLDDGAMWATSYALNELTAAGEARIAELVQKAAG